MYKVIRYFEDIEDEGRPYHVGDIYPRDGLSVKEERIRVLAGKRNALGAPLIILVEEEKSKENEDERIDNHDKSQGDAGHCDRTDG